MGNQSSQNVDLGEILENDIEVSWTKSTDCSFPVREGQCACSHGNKLYVYGGVVQDQEEELVESNNLYRFNTEEKTWSLVEAKGSKPPPCSAASLVTVGNALYLFGGLSHQSGWFDNLYCFDIGTQRWTEVVTEGQKPSPRDKLQAVSIKTLIYYFGGFGPKETGDNKEEEWEDLDEEDEDIIGEEHNQQAAEFGWFNDIFVFDTVSNKWSQPMQLNLAVPSARAAHSMCAVGDNLYIFGGRDTEKRQNDLHVFNVVTRKWDTSLVCTGRMPGQRSFHTATAVGSRMVVMGGRAANNDHFADLHIFNTETHEWLQPKIGGTFPAARGQHSAVTVGEELILYGGSGQFSAETMVCHKFFGDTYIMNTADILKGGAVGKKEGQNGDSSNQADSSKVSS